MPKRTRARSQMCSTNNSCPASSATTRSVPRGIGKRIVCLVLFLGSYSANKSAAADTFVDIIGDAGRSASNVDDPKYKSRLGLTCSQHELLKCDLLGHIGYAASEVKELLRKCPKSCDFSMEFRGAGFGGGGGAQKFRPNNNKQLNGGNQKRPQQQRQPRPTDDRVVGDGELSTCFDGQCQDDVFYRFKLSLSCERFVMFDCSRFASVGFTNDETIELLNSCPCSCGIECAVSRGSKTSSPTSAPSTVLPTSTPSGAPTNLPTGVPSARPTSRPSPFPSTNSPSKAPVTTSPTSFPSAMPTISPTAVVSAHPTLAPTISALPTFEPITVVVQGSTFDIVLAMMTTYLDDDSIAVLGDAFNAVVANAIVLDDPNSVRFEVTTSVVSQEFVDSKWALTIRLVAIASVTVRALDESGAYDESLVPSVSNLDAATQLVFTSNALKEMFLEKLRESGSSVFGYVAGVRFVDFFTRAPTATPSSSPSQGPTITGSKEPSSAPSDVSSASLNPSSSPSQVPSPLPSAPPVVPTNHPADVISDSDPNSCSNVTVEVECTTRLDDGSEVDCNSLRKSMLEGKDRVVVRWKYISTNNCPYQRVMASQNKRRCSVCMPEGLNCGKGGDVFEPNGAEELVIIDPYETVTAFEKESINVIRPNPCLHSRAVKLLIQTTNEEETGSFTVESTNTFEALTLYETDAPTPEPSSLFSANPSALPTSTLSSAPSESPSSAPSRDPSSQPTAVPSSTPSLQHSASPSESPSSAPSSNPSSQPTVMPSSMPSLEHSSIPSITASGIPSSDPMSMPSPFPSSSPTYSPTHQPSPEPTGAPVTSLPTSTHPTVAPTAAALSVQPSFEPTISASHTFAPIVISIRGTPFNIELAFLTQYLDDESIEVLVDASNKAIANEIVLDNPDATNLDIATNLVSQEFVDSNWSLTLRLVGVASVTVHTLDENGAPDKSLVPSVISSLDDATQLVFTNADLRKAFMERLRESALSAFDYVAGVKFIDFSSQAPTTAERPSDEPSFQPSSVPTGDPTRFPSLLPSLEPSSSPSKSHSLAPSFEPSCQPSPQPSPLPSRSPVTISLSPPPSFHPSTAPTAHSTPMPSPAFSSSPSTIPSQKSSNVPMTFIPTQTPLDVNTIAKPPGAPASANPTGGTSPVAGSRTFMPSGAPVTSIPTHKPTLTRDAVDAAEPEKDSVVEDISPRIYSPEENKDDVHIPNQNVFADDSGEQTTAPFGKSSSTTFLIMYVFVGLAFLLLSAWLAYYAFGHLKKDKRAKVEVTNNDAQRQQVYNVPERIQIGAV